MNKGFSITKGMAKLVILIATIVTIGFILSCAPPRVAKITAIVPARFHEASKLKEVAVLPFDGTGGKEFANQIEGTIASINIGDKQYFSIIDRTKLERIIDQELKLSQTGLTDPKTAAKVGKAVGAKGIYTGSVTASNSNSSDYKESRTRCSYYVTKYNKKEKSYQECGAYENYTVSCTKRVAAFSATPKLIEVESGRIIYSNNISGTATSAVCSDSGKPLASDFELIEEAKKIATGAFRKDIAPYYVTFDIKLMDSNEGITSKDAEAKLNQGLDFAYNSRLDRACELWGEARILSSNSPSILYNLGLCSEATGELEQALDLYKKADRLLNKPDDRITAALNRVSEAIRKQKSLKEQLKSSEQKE